MPTLSERRYGKRERVGSLRLIVDEGEEAQRARLSKLQLGAEASAAAAHVVPMYLGSSAAAAGSARASGSGAAAAGGGAAGSRHTNTGPGSGGAAAVRRGDGSSNGLRGGPFKLIKAILRLGQLQQPATAACSSCRHGRMRIWRARQSNNEANSRRYAVHSTV